MRLNIFNIIKNTETKTADMIVYGVIGLDTTSKDIMQQVRELKNDGIEKLNVFIDSPGGRVSEGMAIYNAVKSMDSTTYVYGQAASIASVIALAGKKVVMTPYSHMMIHSPWSFSIGSAKDLREDADVLDKHGDLIVAAYKNRTNADDDTFKAMMDKETWMNAKEAKDLGFCDEVQESYEAQNSSKNFINLIFNLFEQKYNVHKKIEDNDMKLSNDALAKLGLDENATEEQVNAAIMAQNDDLDTVAEPTTDGDAVAELTETVGTIADSVKVLADEIKDLKGDKETDRATEITNMVEQAVADYKINSAEKENWIDNLTHDFEKYSAKLSAIPKDAVKPGTVETPRSESKNEDAEVSNRQKFIEHVSAKIKQNMNA